MIMLQAIYMAASLGITVPQGAALTSGKMAVSQETPLEFTNITLLFTQHPGFTPGQLSRVDALLDTIHLVSTHIMYGYPGKCRHCKTKGQKKEYSFTKMLFHNESSYI
jgi:hypothetical protein